MKENLKLFLFGVVAIFIAGFLLIVLVKVADWDAVGNLTLTDRPHPIEGLGFKEGDFIRVVQPGYSVAGYWFKAGGDYIKIVIPEVQCPKDPLILRFNGCHPERRMFIRTSLIEVIQKEESPD